jgi:acid phosphatase type 7
LRRRRERTLVALGAVLVAGGAAAGVLLGGESTRSAARGVSLEAAAYVLRARPDANFGGARTLIVSSAGAARAYLRFNVKGLTRPLGRARLRLVVVGGTGGELVVQRPSGASWREGAVTSANAPAPAPGPPVAIVHASSRGRLEADVTPLVTGNGDVELVLAARGNGTRILLAGRRGAATAPTLTVARAAVAITHPAAGEIVGPHPVVSGVAGSANAPASAVILSLAGRAGRRAAAHTSGASWTAPLSLDPGRYTLRATARLAGGRRVASVPIAISVARDPVVAAAGDIACDPRNGQFHGGAGPPSGISCQESATAQLIDGADLAGVLTLGDTQYESADSAAFNASFKPTWGRFKALIHPATGNHEYQVPHAQGYFDYFDGPGKPNGQAGPRATGWYSYNVDAWHLIVLNSNCRYIGGCNQSSAQMRWLRADLATHHARCTLAYWHHPRYSSGLHGDQTVMQAIWQTLYQAGADVVLAGHDHDYERFAPLSAAGAPDPRRGIREFVVGTGGKNHDQFRAIEPHSQTHTANAFGVLELTLHPDSYDWHFQPAAGSSYTDQGHQRCH